jgi:hypothetical protein
MAEVRAAAMIESLGGEYPLPIYAAELEPPRPFLVPSLDGEPVEILPSQKASQKIRWEESILVKTINNRFMNEEFPEDDEEGSYEIEIVEEGEDDDADFYVEIVDGEVFYVFETEDDISEESSSSGESGSDSDSESEAGPVAPAQFSIPMEVPTLDEPSGPSVRSQSTFAPSKVPTFVSSDSANFEDFNESRDFNASALTMGESFAFLDVDDDDLEANAFMNENATDKLPTKPTRGDGEVVHERLTDKSPITPMRCSSPWDELSQFDELKESESQAGESIDVLQFEGSLDGEEKKSVGEGGTVTPLKPSLFESEANVSSAPKMPLRGGSPAWTPKNVAPAAPGSIESEASNRSPLGSPGKSILKAGPESPKRSPKTSENPRKKKKEKGVKEKKTFTKTYVRAEDFDGESRVYTWEKPQWTNTQLKSTSQGEKMIREGGNLASPITHIEKNINANVEDDDADSGMEKVDKEELIRRIKGASGMRGHRKLKFSIHGAKIREGGDIVQPITKATAFRKRDDVNLEANPAMLKPTDVGQKARKGGNLAGPITQAPHLRKPETNKEVLRRVAPVRSKSYEWEKPEWSSGRTTLRATKRNEVVTEGGDVAQPITRHIPKQTSESERDLTSYGKKTYEWEKPVWAKGTKLKSTGKAHQMMTEGNLASAITNLPHSKAEGEGNFAKPEWAGGGETQPGAGSGVKSERSRSSSADR